VGTCISKLHEIVGASALKGSVLALALGDSGETAPIILESLNFLTTSDGCVGIVRDKEGIILTLYLCVGVQAVNSRAPL